MDYCRVYKSTTDYRGERLDSKLNGVIITRQALQELLGSTLLAYESVSMPEPNVYAFKGSYQGAHGGGELRGAEIEFQWLTEEEAEALEVEKVLRDLGLDDLEAL